LSSFILSVSEEVLSSNKALWFSPDGKKLAYATFNDNKTKVMSIPFYGLPGNQEYQYTHAVNIRYPKVSEMSLMHKEMDTLTVCKKLNYTKKWINSQFARS
jgi:dipeptidyl-peptidase-4